MIAYTLCLVGDIAHIIIRYKYFLTSQDWILSEAYLAGANDTAYYLGNFTFFLLLLQRIKTSFQLSKCMMRYLLLLLIISITSSTIYCFLMFYGAGKTGSKVESDAEIISYPLAVGDFILNLSLFVIFVHKIYNKDSMEGMEIADDISTSVSQGGINEDKKAIWNVMIKHCMLFGIVLIVNQAWPVLVIIDILIVDANNFPYILARDYTIRSFENVTNIVILWLALKINNDIYVIYVNVGIYVF